MFFTRLGSKGPLQVALPFKAKKKVLLICSHIRQTLAQVVVTQLHATKRVAALTALSSSFARSTATHTPY
jgi:hypothetical protein